MSALHGAMALAAMLSLAAVVAPSARAQQCLEGRVPVAPGICCAANERWDGAHCVPATACADPWTASETCAPREAHVPSGAARAAFTDPGAPPSSGETVARHRLVGLGVAPLAMGWTGATSLGIVYSTFEGGCRPRYGLVGIVPVVGGVIAAALMSECDYGFTDWLFFGIASALQVVGLVMTIVGLVDRRPAPRSVRTWIEDGALLRF